MMTLLTDSVELLLLFHPTGRALVLVLFLTIFMWFRSRLARQKRISPIPGIKVVPGAHWLFGHAKHAMGPIKVGGEDFCDRFFVDHANELGLSCVYIMNKPAISVLCAKHARIVLRQGSRRDVPAIIRRHARQTLGKQSLILQSGGSDWKKQRGLVQYALTADAIMEHNSIIMEVANATVRALKILCKKAPQNDCKSVEVNVVNIAQCFTLEVFGKVALAHDFHCFDDSGANRTREAEAFAFLLNDIPLRVNSWNPFLHTYWLPTPYNKTYEVERGICENFLCNVIKQSKDVLATKDCSTSNGKRHHENMLTHIIRRSEDATENLVDMMKTILFAGYETTAITISFVLFNLTKFPEFQERCSEEARLILQGEDGVNVSNLRYTRACILESMRLNPTVLFSTRNLQKTINLDGFIVPAGTNVIVPFTKILVDERNFERAKEFIPERWVRWDKNKWVDRDHRTEPRDQCPAAADPANFLAFSDGARDCVGKRLAMNEATVALAFLMKGFKVAYENKRPLIFKSRLTSWFPHELQIKFLMRDDVE